MHVSGAEREMKHFRKSDYFIIALIVVVFAAVIWMNSIQMMDTLSEQINNSASLRLDGIQTELQEVLSKAEASLTDFGLSMERLQRANVSEEAVRDYIDSVKEEQILRTNGVNFNSYVASKDFVYIPDFDMPKDYYATERNWYVGAVEAGGQIYVTEPYIDRMTGDICFTMSRMLSDKDTVVSMDFTLGEVQKSIDKMVGGAKEYTALIVTKDGMIMGYSDMSYVGGTVEKNLPQYKDILTYLNRHKEREPQSELIDDTLYTVFCNETDNGWYMILFANEEMLYGQTYKDITFRAVLFVAMLAAIVGLYIFGAYKRSKAERALAAKNEILSNITTELREPLNKIIKLSDSDRLKNSVNIKENLESIKESGLQLDGMITNLFSYSMLAREETRKKREKNKVRDLTKSIKLARNLISIIFAAGIVLNFILTIGVARKNEMIGLSLEVQQYGRQIEKWTTEQKAILSMYANQISTNPEILDDYDSCVAWMDKIAQNYPEISVCYIANPYREHTVIMNNGWEPEKGWDVEDRQWYKDTVLSEDGYSISTPYIDNQTGLYCITFSRMVYKDDGEFLGVFGIDCFMDKLIQVLGENYDNYTYAFLTDSDGVIINHPNKEYEMQENRTVNVADTEYAVIKNLGERKLFRDYNGNLVVGNRASVGVSGLYIYIVSDWVYLSSDDYLTVLINTLSLVACIIIVNIVINRIIRWQYEANRQLEEAVEYATNAGNAKSQFLAQMSHEIRTPINAVIGMDEMILRESKDPQILEYATNIQTAGLALLDLVNSILDFSKIEEGKMEIYPVKYNTTDMVDYLYNMISERAEKKGLNLILDVDENLPKTLFGDDVRLKQVIVNILTNAVKYTHEGSVTLTIRKVPDEGEDIGLYVSVKDTGIGIKEEDKDRLFVSFERLEEDKNRNIEGTGLGISIVQGLLDRMNSKLEVESVYGKGSNFFFTVKQKVIDAEPIGKYDPRKPGPVGIHKETVEVHDADILVVDDNDMNLKVASGIFKIYGVVPETAESGKKALSLVRAKRYDLIFLDHMMPGMDGIETLKALKNEDLIYDTPVICLTANAISGVREKYLKEGFNDYLSKPIEVASLEKLLIKYLPADKIIKKTESAVITAGALETAAEGAGNAGETESGNDTGSAKTPLEKLSEHGFDTAAGIEYSAGMEEFYIEMVQTFADGYDEKAKEISEDYEKENLENYRTRVHALKSTAKMIGAMSLSEMALGQETAAKEGNLEEVKSGYEPLMKAYKECVDVIYTCLQ